MMHTATQVLSLFSLFISSTTRPSYSQLLLCYHPRSCGDRLWGYRPGVQRIGRGRLNCPSRIIFVIHSHTTGWSIYLQDVLSFHFLLFNMQLEAMLYKQINVYNLVKRADFCILFVYSEDNVKAFHSFEPDIAKFDTFGTMPDFDA